MVISLRTVGTVMTVTMLVTPAASARLFARTLRQMTIWGAVFGVSEGVVTVHLELDSGRREVDVPPELNDALESAGLRAAFDSFSVLPGGSSSVHTFTSRGAGL